MCRWVGSGAATSCAARKCIAGKRTGRGEKKRKKTIRKRALESARPGDSPDQAGPLFERSRQTFCEHAAGKARHAGKAHRKDVDRERALRRGAEVRHVFDREHAVLRAVTVHGIVFGAEPHPGKVEADERDLFFDEFFNEVDGKRGVFREVLLASVGFRFDVAREESDEHAGLDFREVDVVDADLAVHGHATHVEDPALAAAIFQGEGLVFHVEVGADVAVEAAGEVRRGGGLHLLGDFKC